MRLHGTDHLNKIWIGIPGNNGHHLDSCESDLEKPRLTCATDIVIHLSLLSLAASHHIDIFLTLSSPVTKPETSRITVQASPDLRPRYALCHSAFNLKYESRKDIANLRLLLNSKDTRKIAALRRLFSSSCGGLQPLAATFSDVF